MENITYTVVYEPEVEQALNEILFYYAQKGGKDLVERMFDNIVLQLDTLETMPFRYQVSDFSENIRKMVIQTPPYLAFYTVSDTKVKILELFHASMNQNFLYNKYRNR